jgi:hypothetical protein
MNGENMSPNYPINDTNPASCTEGSPVFCDGYAQGYPHSIKHALGSELGTKVADQDLKGLHTGKSAIMS